MFLNVLQTWVTLTPDEPPNGEKAETLETLRERDGDRLLLPAAAAKLFGVDPRTLGDWARAGKIGFRRTLGGHRRYWETEVRELVAQRAADVDQVA
jgi:excisionase family DNA binding protein